LVLRGSVYRPGRCHVGSNLPYAAIGVGHVLAMYHAKRREGGDGWAHFADDMGDGDDGEPSLENELRAAIEGGLLRPEYLPRGCGSRWTTSAPATRLGGVRAQGFYFSRPISAARVNEMVGAARRV
jgi:hypothetical protein